VFTRTIAWEERQGGEGDRLGEPNLFSVGESRPEGETSSCDLECPVEPRSEL